MAQSSPPVPPPWTLGDRAAYCVAVATLSGGVV